MTSVSKRGALAVALILGVAGAAHADESDDRTIAAGKQQFLNSCAVCHGPDAKGAGIVAGHLNQTPTNLTLLTKKNDGHFPFQQVYETIDGRQSIGVHGSREMPIWGAEFRMGVPTASGMSESVVRGKILELIVYLKSLQVE